MISEAERRENIAYEARQRQERLAKAGVPADQNTYDSNYARVAEAARKGDLKRQEK